MQGHFFNSILGASEGRRQTSGLREAELSCQEFLVLVLLHVDQEHLLQVREGIFVSFPALNHGDCKLEKYPIE